MEGTEGGEGFTKHMRDTFWIQLVCERHGVCNKIGFGKTHLKACPTC